MFGFSYAVSTIVPFVLFSSVSRQTEWLPIGAGLLVWILFFGALFWHLRKRTDLGSDDHWRMPAKITAAAVALTGLVGALLNEAIGEFWATLLSSPFVILLAGWFLLLALHLPILILKESPLAASRARLSRMVFVVGLLTACLGYASMLNSLVPGWLMALPAMLFVSTLGYAIWRLQRR